MHAFRSRQSRTWVGFGATAITVLGVFLAARAYAKIALNTIDPVAVITDNGRQIIVSGPVTATAGERGFQRVTVTQRSTGAVAEGYVILDYTGSPQHWEVRASTVGNATFTEGPATAVAIALCTDRGTATDAHQWLVNINLVNE